MKIELKVIGTEGARLKQLNGILKEALKELKMNNSIEIVSNWEDILGYNIITTPTLLINKNIICQGIIPQREELIIILKAFNNKLIELSSSGMSEKNEPL